MSARARSGVAYPCTQCRPGHSVRIRPITAARGRGNPCPEPEKEGAHVTIAAHPMPAKAPGWAAFTLTSSRPECQGQTAPGYISRGIDQTAPGNPDSAPCQTPAVHAAPHSHSAKSERCSTIQDIAQLYLDWYENGGPYNPFHPDPFTGKKTLAGTLTPEPVAAFLWRYGLVPYYQNWSAAGGPQHPEFNAPHSNQNTVAQRISAMIAGAIAICRACPFLCSGGCMPVHRKGCSEAEPEEARAAGIAQRPTPPRNRQ